MATKTLKIRIKDSTSCKRLKLMSKAVNFVWNYCNQTSFDAIRNRSKWISGFDLQKLTTGSAKELKLNSTTIQEVCREYATRRRQFKKRKLRWRGKKSLGWIPFKKTGISFEGGVVKHNRQTFKVFQPERLPEKGVYGAGEFSEDARGRWYLCISVEYEQEYTSGTSEVGIDLGLKDLATLSNGKKVSNGRYYRMMERKLKHAQRNRKKRLQRTIHAKIRNKRLDDLHKASTNIVKENALIVVGKLEAKKLTKTKMAKSIHDAGTSMFRTMLKYKASAQQHCIYVEVNEAYSTQTCSSCHTVSGPKGLEGLGVREWVCCCGAKHDRDINAALNILRFGRQLPLPEGRGLEGDF